MGNDNTKREPPRTEEIRSILGPRPNMEAQGEGRSYHSEIAEKARLALAEKETQAEARRQKLAQEGRAAANDPSGATDRPKWGRVLLIVLGFSFGAVMIFTLGVMFASVAPPWVQRFMTNTSGSY